MSSFVLKIIALVSMFTDHFGATFGVWLQYAGFSDCYTPMRLIGRIAFPIYAFLIAEGCHRTKNYLKYPLRLFIFALISEIPFDLATENRGFPIMGEMPVFLEFGSQNVYFTLFTAVFSIMIFKRIEEYLKDRSKENIKIVAHIVTIIIILVLSYIFKSDYGAKGALGIFLIYLARNRTEKLAAMFVMIIVIYYDARTVLSYYTLFACISILFVFFYNGKRGPAFKDMFYWAYPVHLAIYSNIWLLYTMPYILRMG